MAPSSHAASHPAWTSRVAPRRTGAGSNLGPAHHGIVGGGCPGERSPGGVNFSRVGPARRRRRRPWTGTGPRPHHHREAPSSLAVVSSSSRRWARSARSAPSPRPAPLHAPGPGARRATGRAARPAGGRLGAAQRRHGPHRTLGRRREQEARHPRLDLQREPARARSGGFLQPGERRPAVTTSPSS